MFRAAPFCILRAERGLGSTTEEENVDVMLRAETLGELDQRDERARRTLAALAGVLAVAAALHLVDHAIRGRIVEDHGLNQEWNHSGWPLRDDVTPYTISLVIPLVFLVGLLLTRRRRVGAGFWLVVGTLTTAVVVLVHFVPGPATETLGVIYRTYDRGIGNPLAGVVAVFGVGIIVFGLAALLTTAIRVRRVSRGS